MRILKTLAVTGFPSYTKYGLERATGLKPAAVRDHLRTLIETGLIKELPLEPRVYILNDRDTFASLLVDLFRKSGYSR